MNILQTFYNSLNDEDKQNVNQPNQCKKCLSFYLIKSVFSSGPVVKQTIINENPSDESSPISAKSQPENPTESAVTNDQTIAPTVSTDKNEKKDEEQEEPADVEEKNTTFKLKNPSACKIIIFL